ncbi:MAG: hypothetical protein WBP13_04980 [Methylophilaceae bacterium]
MNYIDQLRADLKKDFEENTFQKNDVETFLSPSKQFRLDVTNFESKEPNLGLTKVEIFDQNLNEKLFDFFINESPFFYGWVTSNKMDYLICAENIFGGQTVIDLTHRKMAGYSPNEDGFIWTEFHLSPDGKTLATIGCYWACPYVIKLFDFSNPLNLPLTEIKEIRLMDEEITLVWLDNDTLQLKGVKRERELVSSEDGILRMVTISETNVERQI